MAKKTQRVGALVFAIIFLVSSLATSAAVIWALMQDGKSTDTPADATSQQQTNEESSLVGTTMQDFTPVATVDTLQIIDTKVGDGDEAKADSTLTVTYVGALAKDGTIFDASGAQPATFALNQVIKGWQQGVPGMKVGGTRRLLIPAALAYGDQSPTAAIPANSDLVFDITLLAVQ